ncbi:hypothetical protein WR25_14960 [Diploscapter pachys]|uniref:Ribosome biogenesis regulatory protein n=1 Tax=Diploscapter pachys TaxID=2018661 RepID=A0A2A2LS30_9BILA|nr:hypothetical protein WR25_14960 [Diploscapter pachys]
MDLIGHFPSTEVQKDVDPMVDVGNLLLIDRQPVTSDSDELKDRARNNTQLLLNAIWQLERQQVEDAVVAILPAPTYRLPREKIIPQPRQPTKWELYAKAKGIKKRTKDKKKFDDLTGEWKPTYGYRRGNDSTKDWVIEIPQNAADPMKDFFEERIEAKKERVAKNEMQRLKNIAKQLNSTVKKGESTDKLIGVGVNPMEKTKQQVRFAADRARAATASAGKFQETIKGEKPNVKTGKKRKFEPNEGKITEENKRALQIFDKIKAKKIKIIEEKAAEIAGPNSSDEGKKERGKKGKKPARMKSEVHRQQWFKNKIKSKKSASARGGRKGKK